MAWHVYEIPPIDFKWHFLKTVEETAREIGSLEGAAAVSGSDTEGPDLDEFRRAWDKARELALAKGWDGDFRNPPVVFWVPGDTEFAFGFAFKQDNNGTTYVVSPVELPHLED